MAQLELPGFDETALTLRTGLVWSLASVSPAGVRFYVSEPDADGVTWFWYVGKLDHATRSAMIDLARGGPVRHLVEHMALNRSAT